VLVVGGVKIQVAVVSSDITVLGMIELVHFGGGIRHLDEEKVYWKMEDSIVIESDLHMGIWAQLFCFWDHEPS